jgi:hypothetical protein
LGVLFIGGVAAFVIVAAIVAELLGASPFSPVLVASCAAVVLPGWLAVAWFRRPHRFHRIVLRADHVEVEGWMIRREDNYDAVRLVRQQKHALESQADATILRIRSPRLGSQSVAMTRDESERCFQQLVSRCQNATLIDLDDTTYLPERADAREAAIVDLRRFWRHEAMLHLLVGVIALTIAGMVIVNMILGLTSSLGGWGNVPFLIAAGALAAHQIWTAIRKLRHAKRVET